MVESLVVWIPGLPALVAASIVVGWFTGRNREEAGERATALLATGATVLSLLLLLVLDAAALMMENAPGQVSYRPWLESGDFQVMFSFTLDRLSLAMATLVATIAVLTLRFSVNYMHREGGFQRFFAVLCLFVAAMLLIVLAGNGVMMFVGWEVAGLSSYLLIGYAYDRSIATGNAVRALVTNRFGDAGFIVGIVLTHHWLLGLEWPQIVAHVQQVDNLHVGLIAGGFMLAALAKSGQFPFVGWLPRALEGPTPSSAIFYGSLMVHAGVYLLLRLEPLLVEVPVIMGLLVCLGGVTTFYGFFSGLAQTDVKSALLFSTQSQVGMMFLACGMGWFEFAFWHMLAHAAWRAYLFLNAPAYMHLVHGPVRHVPSWLANNLFLYAAATRRFWVDTLEEQLIIRPTQALSQDVQTFDDLVIDRMVGHIHGGRNPSSLEEWEAQRQKFHENEGIDIDFAWGRGILGNMLERIASQLHRFEERLLLGSGGDGLLQSLRRLGHILELTDNLLEQPRYLLLLVVLTFVVIL
ncbi:conserved membrane hypothetical protein [Gammaproteobacteria bacterium]